MNPSLDVLYDIEDCGRRIVIALLPDPTVLSEARLLYGPVSDCNNTKRSLEIFGSHILVNQLYPGAIVKHGANREPILLACDEYTEISVSHTTDKIALIFSNQNSGIDIEKTTRNMGRVADRFLSENERIMVGKEGLIAAWCAKEALFKYLKGKGIIFLNEFSIKSFAREKIVLEYMEKRFTVSVTTVGDTTLAYL